jgi:hypothetical protein
MMTQMSDRSIHRGLPNDEIVSGCYETLTRCFLSDGHWSPDGVLMFPAGRLPP